MNIKVRPLNRILVKMVSVTEDHRHLMGSVLKGLGISTVDRNKHFEHLSRRGIVSAIPEGMQTEFRIGDVVLFKGYAGFTLDGDVMDEGLDDHEPLKGEGYRWLKASEVEAIDEEMTERLSPKAIELEVVHAAD